MPSNDLVLNVRQIAGYPDAGQPLPTDSLLLQRSLGGPYLSISPVSLVGNALSQTGSMAINGAFSALTVQGGSATFANANVGILTGQQGSFTELDATYGSIAGVPIATTAFASGLVAGLRAETVWSVNGRRGDVTLTVWDVCGAAPIYSPRFTGEPRAETPQPWSCSSRLATTAFVHGSIVCYLNNFAQEGVVSSFNGRGGAVVLTAADITAANPGYAPIDSPNFSGLPTAPTAPIGTSTGQLATTAFVMNAVAESVTGVATFNGRTGNVVLDGPDVMAAGGALLVSPQFTGVPQAPTATPGTSTLQLANTAFVGAAITAAGVNYAPLASPNFSGVPTGPTAATGVATSQLATTAFVQNTVNAIDAGVVTFNGRTGAVVLTANDVSGAGGLINPNTVLTGVPTAPTATAGTATTQLATCAFVTAALAAISVPGPSTSPPLMDGTASAGTSVLYARGDHVHPTDTSRAAASALAGYLPLSAGAGNALTGMLFGATATFSGGVTAAGLTTTNGSMAVKQTGTSDASLYFQNSAGTNVGSVGWAATNNTVALTNIASTGTVTIDSGGVTTVSGPLNANGTIAALSGSLVARALGAGNAALIFQNAVPTQVGSVGWSTNNTISLWNNVSNQGLNINSAGVSSFSALLQLGTAGLAIDTGNGQVKPLYGRTAGVTKWTLYLGNGITETGGNVGADLQFSSASDTGSFLQNPLIMSRATGVCTFSQPIVNGSDRRLKENIAPISDALAKVLALTGVSFNRIGQAKREIGFIAQDVLPVAPEVIHETRDPGDPQSKAKREEAAYLGVAYAQITALLVEAVKELAARVDNLEARTA